MATVYKIKAKVVSPFVSYPEAELEKILKELFEKWRDPKTGMKLESIELSAEKIA